MQQVPDVHAASSHPSTDGHGVTGALGKVGDAIKAPFEKLEEKRSEQAGDFQQRRGAEVQQAKAEMQAAQDAGHKVEARPGMVKIDGQAMNS